MLRRVQSQKILGSVRFSSTGNTFTSNRTLNMLDLGASVTGEEPNIPKRPKIIDTPKVHLEMLSPEEMCDLIIKLDFRDLFITSLARDSPFSGDCNYKPISKKLNSTPDTLKLLFTDIVSKYQDVFNSQIVKLQPQKGRVEFPIINQKTINLFDEKVTEFKKISKLTQPLTLENFRELGNYLQVLTPKDALGLNKHQLSNDTISIENFFIYLLKNINKYTTEEHQAIIELMTNHIASILIEGLRRILEIILQELHQNEERDVVISGYATFINENILDRIPHLMGQLHPSQQENLVKIFIKSGDIMRARRTLKRIIYKGKTLPSTKTIEDYLMTYETYKNEQNREKDSQLLDREKTIKYNLFLKPVFFSTQLTPKLVSWILTTIDSSFELDHLVRRLIEQNDQELMNEVGPLILKKCIEIVEPESNVSSCVKITQLFISLQKNGLELKTDDKKPLVKFFTDRGLVDNAEYIKRL